jgi:hypothetical protein
MSGFAPTDSFADPSIGSHPPTGRQHQSPFPRSTTLGKPTAKYHHFRPTVGIIVVEWHYAPHPLVLLRPRHDRPDMPPRPDALQ